MSRPLPITAMWERELGVENILTARVDGQKITCEILKDGTYVYSTPGYTTFDDRTTTLLSPESVITTIQLK